MAGFLKIMASVNLTKVDIKREELIIGFAGTAKF